MCGVRKISYTFLFCPRIDYHYNFYFFLAWWFKKIMMGCLHCDRGEDVHF